MTVQSPRAVGTLLLLSLTASFSAVGETPSQPPGQLVEVSGHTMHLYCTGIGSPTVVLDSGLGGSFLDWSRVQPVVSDHTQVCSYDRSGYGYSEPGTRPRTSRMIADELRALLREGGIEGPYVLVGHSFGGFNVRLFASRYPGDVAGLVLVDSSQGAQMERLESNGGRAVAPRGRFMVFSPTSIPPNLPAHLRPMARDMIYNPRTNRTVHTELRSFRQSAHQVRTAPALPDVPLVVITRGEREWYGSERAERRESIWQTLQREFVERNPGSIHLVAAHSGHYVPLEQPRVVVGGICMAVQSSRAGNHWARLPAGWLEQRCIAPLRVTRSVRRN